MGTWRFDWRYAAAGLGWGVVVGALTGVLIAVVTVVMGLWSGNLTGFSGVMFVFLAPVLGVVYGAAPGAVVGLVAGLATALTVGGSLDRRRTRWTAAATTLVVGLVSAIWGSVLVGAGGLTPASVLLLGVPVSLGAYLMARTTGSVIAAAEHRAIAYPA